MEMEWAQELCGRLKLHWVFLKVLGSDGGAGSCWCTLGPWVSKRMCRVPRVQNEYCACIVRTGMHLLPLGHLLLGVLGTAVAFWF